MQPKTTALVLIEFQNDFTAPGGALHDAVAGSMRTTSMLANTVETVAAARQAGVTVVFAPIQFAPGYFEIASTPYGILAGVVASNAFVKGSWGAAFDDTLLPQAGDIVLEGKRGLDAFGSTNIDFILRSKGIETVVLAGFLTNCCVESTMRSAYERGFEVVTLTDCVAATSDEEHDSAIKFDYPMFSKPQTHLEFIAALTAGAETSDTSRGY
ncbi:MAG: cysteine hydrolase [Bifidobacteriaceae bacterium]|jgi:nicotinamidase-related amidase|nr:cysteine hydrolase [Bifidobacteriaceae bacterium]